LCVFSSPPLNETRAQARSQKKEISFKHLLEISSDLAYQATELLDIC
jgi:hypothetical protein